MQNYSQDYLLDKQVKIFQPINGYRASTDAVFLSAMVSSVRNGDKILDVGSGTGAVSLCLAESLYYILTFPNSANIWPKEGLLSQYLPAGLCRTVSMTPL